MKYHDQTEMEIINKIIHEGGSLILSAPPYFDPKLPTKKHRDALSRLLKNGTVLRGQSHGGHGRRSFITYHLRSEKILGDLKQ